MKKIPRPKVSSKIIQDIPLKVIKKILKHCGHTPFTMERNRAIIMVFLDTGLRLTAISNIMIKDIDFETGLITVVEKGDKPNMVHCGHATMSSIQKYLETGENISNEYFWVNQNGKRTQKSAVQIVIRRLRKYGGDYRWTPHTFRNT